MKLKCSNLFLLAAATGFAISSAHAAVDQTWIDGTVGKSWSTSAPNWDAAVNWTNGNNAIFNGAGETVTAVGTPTFTNLTFNGNYTVSGGTALAANGIITVANTKSATINALGGNGFSLTKTGAGILTVYGAQSYTGDTNVLQGTFLMGDTSSASLATSGVTVSTGATFMLGNGTLSSTQNITGAGNFSKDTVISVVSGTINGTNNNYTGSTGVYCGTLTLGSGAVINGTSSIALDGINGSNIINNGSITTVGALLIFGKGDTNAGLFTNGNVDGTSPGTFNAASMTLGNANGRTSGTAAHGGAFTNNLNSAVSLSGGLTVEGEGSTTIPSSPIGSLFTNSGGTVTIGGSLILNSSSTGNTFSNKGGTYTQTAGTTTTTGALNLVESGSVIASGAAGNDAAFNLSGGSASFSSATLNGTTTVSGTGTLNVSGNFFTGEGSNHSGIFNQTGGTTNVTTTAFSTIRIGHWNGGTGTSTIAVSGGTFNAIGTTSNLGYDGNSALTVSGTGVANFKGLISGRSSSKTGTVTLTGGRLNIGTDGIAQDQATMSINFGAGTVGAFGGNWSSSLAMSLTDAVTGTTFNTLDSVDLATGQTITLSGVISGVGALTKSGAGTLTLSGANSYAGGTTINSGILTVSTSTVAEAKTGLGIGVVTANSGTTLRFFTSSTSAAQSYSNAINLNSATLVSQDGVVNYSGAITLTGSNTVNVVWDTKNATFSNVVSGTGSLTLTNSGGNSGGKLSLSGANTYTGNTTVSAGTLQLPSTGRLKFRLGSTSGTSNTLSGAGAATLDGGFSVDTTAADSLITGTWTLETMGATSTYGSSFKVYQANGTTAWTDAGSNKWTQTGAAGRTWTFDEATGTLTLATVGFDSWASTKGLTGGNAAFDGDLDNDGIGNGLEFVLGGEPNPATVGSNSAALLPTVSQATGNLVYTFKRKDISESGVSLKFQWSTDLSFTSPANDVPIGAVDSTTDTITVDVTEDAPNVDTDTIVITIPAAKAAGGKIFGRLSAAKAP